MGHIVKYGVILALLLMLLKWVELRFLLYSHSQEMMFGAVALIFTMLGIWVATRLMKPKVKTMVIEKEIIVEHKPEFEFNQEAFKAIGLTERELEVLEKMSLGFSNQEIADALSLSVPTIKTHASKMFEKMDVKRRTQAIEKGKSLKIIP